MIIVRISSIAVGLLMVLMSTLLYETEEGTIQNKLEAAWVVLTDAERYAVNRHAAFMAGVAGLGSSLFDRIFGQRLLSLRSVGVSACFSLASLFLVCSPGLSGLLFELPGLLYYSILVGLLAMGVLPSVLGSRGNSRKIRLFKSLWLAGVVVLMFLVYACMDAVDWFNLPMRVVLKGTFFDVEPRYSVEVFYYVAFIVLTIASDSLFIAATRWLLRKGSQFHSRVKILGLMLGNVLLACALVILPIALAWGISAVAKIMRSGHLVESTNQYVGFSNAHQSFLASLGASNVLDGLVACVFFVLLFALLLHRLVWPTVQRPVYALANRGIIRRRKLFSILGVALIGLGGVPGPAVHAVRKILDWMLG